VVDAVPASYAALADPHKTHPLLKYALERTGLRRGRALDIGAGALGETRYLLERGFDVDAVDPDPVSRQLADTLDAGVRRFTMSQKHIEAHRIPALAYDLVVALHVLPFVAPDRIDGVAADIERSLVPGGVLCCTLFGRRDSWAVSDLPVTGVTERRSSELFAGLRPLYFEESEHDGVDAEGKPKHWHVLRQVLGKPRSSLRSAGLADCSVARTRT
jgi:SAM-dependent methyltransferase